MNATGSYGWNNTSQWSQLSSNSTPPQSNNLPQNNTQIPQSTMQSSPETRRDSITRLYKYILGREADSAGLNYYLSNFQITEADIAREMFESTEHQEILQKAKDIRQIVQKLEENDKRMRDMQISLQKAEALVESYKALLEQKAHMIQELQNHPTTESNSNAAYETQSINEFSQAQESQPQSTPASNQTEYLLDDPFAEDYEKKKGKGCIGKIKGLFKFN
jgi:hypothetical protein